MALAPLDPCVALTDFSTAAAARSTCSAATDLFETLDAVRANWKALFIFTAESASSAVPSAILCLYSAASSQLALKSFQNV